MAGNRQRERFVYTPDTHTLSPAADEIKTKPTQHSVGMLRQAGIEPDILICRTEKPLSSEIKEDFTFL